MMATVKANARAITNADLWEQLRNKFPSFAAHTAKGTADLFTERGFERIQQYDASVLNDFFTLSMRVWLNVVNISHAKDPLADYDFGEYFDQPWGGYIHRLSTNSIKPISPAYKGLKDGDSPDPFVVRKPVTNERFWVQNFDYQSLVTIPDEFQIKQIFISEYGMSEYMAGIFEGLQNGYTVQVYLNKLEALNAALTSTKDPLQSTQVFNVTYSATPTEQELKNLQLAFFNAVTAMTIAPQTGAFNAAGFVSTQDKSRLRLLVRPGYKAALAVNVMTGAFNPQYLNLDIPIIEVPNFGGLKPFKEAAFTTPLYPVYNALGEEIGWAESAGSTTVTTPLGQEFYQDPNATTIAVLADKGVVFECRQNPYRVEPIRNPRGLYTNHWASSPNNTIAYDPYYNLIAFQTTGA